MSWNIPILSLGFCTVMAAAAPVAAQTSEQPKSVALCLPPGATTPVACGSARAGQTIRLQVATTSLPTGPIDLLFTEEGAAGRAPRTASITIPPERSRDGGYEVTVPPQLCTAGRDRMGNFEIQHLMGTINESETIRRSLGTITIAC